MNPQHLSESAEHYTPAEIAFLAREVLNGIDLDPASTLEANQTIKAQQIYTWEDNGLAQKWHGKVFLNPPGGSLAIKQEDPPHVARYKHKASQIFGTKSHAVAWWRKLQMEVEAGRVEAFVFLAFSLEILCSSQGVGKPMLDYALCVPCQRVRFVAPGGRVGRAPTHASAVIYEGPSVGKFRDSFTTIGTVRT